MAAWHELPDEAPADATKCWVTLVRWFATPFEATWNDAAATWSLLQLPNAPTLPWQFAPRWREL